MSRPPPAFATTSAAAAAATSTVPNVLSTSSPALRNIAVSVNKPSRAFFNIARKAMLEGVDVVQLSALESAIAIAIDTTFLLTSATMAEIESIETAFVDVPYYHLGPGQQQEHHHHHMARKARMTIRLRKTDTFREYARIRQEQFIGIEEFEEDD